MKNIFKSFLAIAAGSLLFASCVEEQEPMAASVAASQTEVTLAGDSYDTKTINITADGDWILVNSAEWFTADPTSGSGDGVVTLKVKDLNVDSFNELNGPRSEKIYLFGNEGQVVITVNQYGESGLDASRTYAKITSASEIEAGKGYLIVANDGSALQAAKGFSTSSDTYYSYLYADKVEEASDGVIVRSNANNGFTLVDAGEGLYYIAMPGGRYLYQSASYNNFYSTDDTAKADKWSVSFESNGTAKITNAGAAAGKYFQYSIGYTSYGAYGSAQDNAALPYLYKDSAAPSSEVLSIPASTTVKAEDVTVSIPVTSNSTWKVRNHDSWIKSFTAQGKGNGEIVVTFDPNESETDQKVATFHIIGETTNFEITLTQDKYYPITDATVAEFLAAETGSRKYRLTGKIAEEYNSTYGNVYIQDGTGIVYVYGLCETDELVSKSYGNLGLRQGDIITIVGQRDYYAKGKEGQKDQVKNAYCEASVKSTDATVTEILKADVASTYLESPYYRVKGVVKKMVNDTYGNFYLQAEDSEDYIYVYGLTVAPVAKNDKTFGTLGIKEGDIVTLVGQRGSYEKSKVEDQKNQIANAYYISHETPSSEEPEPEDPVGPAPSPATVVITVANMPSSYPTAETVVSENGVDCYIINVANYGNGIQFKGKVGSYLANKTAMPAKIKSIKLTGNSGKAYYPGNLTLYAGTAEKPDQVKIEETGDKESKTSVFDLSSGEYTFFTLKNTSDYGVYIDKIEISY